MPGSLSRKREREQCPAPSPASGRGSNARPPLPHAGEGWGEGGRVPAMILFLMRRRERRGWQSKNCLNFSASFCVLFAS